MMYDVLNKLLEAERAEVLHVPGTRVTADEGTSFEAQDDGSWEREDVNG